MDIRLGLDALTRAVVGPRPADPVPAALPDMIQAPGADGLVKCSCRSLPIMPNRFRSSHQPWANGRIAVGADILAKHRCELLPAISGRIWLAGKPHNVPGSQVIHFSDLGVPGGSSTHDNLLVAVAGNPGFFDAIGDALTQNFMHDFDSPQTRINHALANRQQGNLRIDAQLHSGDNDQRAARGNGLTMPVTLTGRASVAYDLSIGDPSMAKHPK